MNQPVTVVNAPAPKTFAIPAAPVSLPAGPSNIHVAPTSDTADFARSKLATIVQSGIKRAAPVIDRVLNEIPEDRVIAARAMHFDVDAEGRVMVAAGDDFAGQLHDHAFGQVLERAGVPKAYASSLLATKDEDWKRELLEHILATHYSNDAARYLVRAVKTDVRAVLSDRFRRLDSRPLLDAFIGSCREIGAVPFEGVASDIRSSVRAIVPTVYEPVPGEAMVFGLAWNNSDYGAGAYGISAFVLRLVCLNGAVGASALRKAHLGRQLDDNIEFSQKTYQLDTDTMVSATRDIVRNVLSPKAIETQCDLVRAAHGTEIDFSRAFRKVSAALSKTEAKAVEDTFRSADVVMLPAGETAWRFSNALSWVANQAESADRKLELQALAGAAISA